MRETCHVLGDVNQSRQRNFRCDIAIGSGLGSHFMLCYNFWCFKIIMSVLNSRLIRLSCGCNDPQLSAQFSSSFMAWLTLKMSHFGINWITIRKYVVKADRIWKKWKVDTREFNLRRVHYFTPRNVPFPMSKARFAVNSSFVVINCSEKLCSCFELSMLQKLRRLDSSWSADEMLLHSLRAELQEQKTPISETSGWKHKMNDAARNEKVKHQQQRALALFLTNKVISERRTAHSNVLPVEVND